MPPADIFWRSEDQLPLAFGVSGPLGTQLMGEGAVAGIIRRAFEEGVGWFDTAPAYGAGLAETRLGRAIAGLEGTKVATKAGVSASGLARRTRDFSPDAVERSLDSSLARLDRGAVELLWLHGPAPHELSDDLLMRLDRMCSDGRFRALGLATRPVALAGSLERTGFDAIMLPCHAGLNEEGLQALAQAREQSAVLFGIEALAPARLSHSPLAGTGGLWRTLKALRHRPQPPAHNPLSVPDCLEWALRAVGPGHVTTTTTRPAHLAETVAITRAWLARTGSDR